MKLILLLILCVVIGLTLILCVVIGLTPIALIWAIETLSGHFIPLTWDTWFAALLICVILGGTTRSSK